MIETAGQSVSAERAIPQILRRANDIERIIELVVTQAEHTREQLGTSVPRSVHQLVLINSLIHMGLAVDTEPTLCSLNTYNEQSRCVLAVGDRLLIECLAEVDAERVYQRRMQHELDNSHYETGLLIAYGNSSCYGAVTRVMRGYSLH